MPDYGLDHRWFIPPHGFEIRHAVVRGRGGEAALARPELVPLDDPALDWREYWPVKK